MKCPRETVKADMELKSKSVSLNTSFFPALVQLHELQNSFQAQVKRNSNEGLTLYKPPCLPMSFPSTS